MEKTFSVYDEPHVAVVGPRRFEFEPEIDTAEFFDRWAALRKTAAMTPPEIPEDTPADEVEQIILKTRAERNRRSRVATDGILTSYMVGDSADRWLEAKLSNRVATEVFNWMLEVYGLRPIGPSSASSTGSSPTESSPSGSTDDSSAPA